MLNQNKKYNHLSLFVFMGITSLASFSAHGACRTEGCRPASMADVRTAIEEKHRLAPVPMPVAGVPVAINAVRSCRLGPNSNGQLSQYTLHEDVVTLNAIKVDSNDITQAYSISCDVPKTANMKIYTKRDGSAVDYHRYDLEPLETFNISESNLKVVSATYRSDKKCSPSKKAAAAAGLESYNITCSVMDITTNANGPWKVMVQIPYCS